MSVHSRLTAVEKLRWEQMETNGLLTNASDSDSVNEEAVVRLVTRSIYDTKLALCRSLFLDISSDQAKKIASISSSATTVAASVYGEIEYASFLHILQLCRPQTGAVFVDLGHGTGKATTIAALMFGDVLSRVYGIELVPELYEVSVEKLIKFEELILQLNAQDRELIQLSLLHKPINELISLELGDILNPDRFLGVDESKFDWTTADIVYACSTCFGFEFMDLISQKANLLKAGSRVITTTIPLKSDQFRVLIQRNLAMSWGIATVFIHVRL